MLTKPNNLLSDPVVDEPSDGHSRKSQPAEIISGHSSQVRRLDVLSLEDKPVAVMSVRKIISDRKLTGSASWPYCA
jgi:hypothetical protein